MSPIFETLCRVIEERKRPVFTLSLISDAYGAENARFCETNRCQNSYSMAKAFIVTAVGLLVDGGRLSVEDKICNLLREELPDGMDSRWEKITVEDALLHRLGLPENFLDIDVHPEINPGFDWLTRLFSEPFAEEPCVRRCYTDAAYYLLGRVVTKVAGVPVDVLLWRELFYPLGFLEVAWSRCPQGYVLGGSGLYVRTEDIVKLGEVYRNDGLWQGRRILSHDWVNLVLSRGYELRPLSCGHGAYGKGGMLGQQLAVFPERGLSVAWHGYQYEEKKELLEILAEA